MFGQEYTLRPYQAEAVEAAVRFFRGPGKKNAIEVLPTGSGKSLVIANIAQRLGAPVLIFQPTKEILEQNYSKMLSYGYSPGIYSASKNRRQVAQITFATIGSVTGKQDLFKDFPYIIVDECHFVNAKGGMYHSFISNHGGKVLGLTATPYRLATDGFGGSILKFLTRTRPRVFHDVIYYVQNKDLLDAGYLAKLEYYPVNGFDRSVLKLNTTGADYTDQSVKDYYRNTDFVSRVVDVVNRVMQHRRNSLVFTRFIEEAEAVTKRIPGAALVTSETPPKEREGIINGWKAGDIKTACNVGVLTTGIDYPELETVILARPTMSLALYYQMIGRGIRPHPDKQSAWIVDMCGNMDLFGKVEDLILHPGTNGKWTINSNGRQLTNIYYEERAA